MTTITDTDKSGHGFQKQKVWLGPSLGWSEEYVQPSTLITTGPTYVVEPGDGMLLIDVPAGITILLPDVKKWFQQVANQPATGWNRQLCIKDFGGNAVTGNIVVVPFGSQRIDENLGIVTITVANAVFMLVPNVDLTGWVIAAGTSSVLIPVGTFLPVHDPHATGVLKVGDVGGNIAAMYGSVAGQQAVSFVADPTSVDSAVNVHIIPKNDGGTLLYSHNSLQMAVSGPANTTEYLVVSGATGLDDPIIANASGGAVRVENEILVGPAGGNFCGLQGSASGQMSVAVRADSISNPDATINITLVPNGAGGVAFWSNNSLQAFVSGPPACQHFVQMSGSAAGNPLIQAAFTTYIDVLNANLTGIPTCPTAPVGTATQQVASTAFVIANAGTGGGGGGNVFNFGTPTVGQYARWVSATSIEGVAASSVLADIGGREKLTANRIYFVRTDGSDSNNGLANTAGGAFLTIQKGIDAACAVDLGVFNCSVRVADGTYNVTSVAPAVKNGMVLKSYVGAGPISIVGNVASPQNVILNVTQGDCVQAQQVLGIYNVAGFTFVANTAGYNTARINGGATNVTFQDIRWGLASIHVLSDYGSQVFLTGKQEIFGDATYHWAFTNHGIIQDVGKTITMTGTRAISAFAYGAFNGLLIANQLAFVGPTSNGQKFLNQSLAIINTGSADLNAFPGTVAGSTWSGGYF